MQYDALMDARCQKLLKGLSRDTFEIGAWWEIPQPLLENSGYKWRGRYPWDWHADVGFATGYSPKERVKLDDLTATVTSTLPLYVGAIRVRFRRGPGRWGSDHP